MINSLQTWRFVFALMIFHHHFFINPQVVQFGTFPVAFFFILSGYVMAIGYEDKVCAASFRYKDYMLKRLLRITPLNLFSLALALIFPLLDDILHLQFHYRTYLLAVIDTFLLQAWIPIRSVYFSGNAVAWFLSSMLFCYILFPYLLKWIKGKYGKIILVVTIAVYFSVIQFIEGKYIHAFIYINPFFRLVDFMIGISLYLSLKGKVNAGRHFIRGSVLELLAVALSIVFLLLYTNVPMRYGLASLYWIPAIALISTFTLTAKMGGGNFIFIQQTPISTFGGAKFSLLYDTCGNNQLVSYSGKEL